MQASVCLKPHGLTTRHFSKRSRAQGCRVRALPALQGGGDLLGACLVLGTTVVFHEAGHFLTARNFGIRVKEFGVGFGPSLAKFKRDNVDYKLNWIPLGGYVAFPEANKEEGIAENDPDLLRNRNAFQRFCVMGAGIFVNFVLAFVLLFGKEAVLGHMINIPRGDVEITGVKRGSAAEIAGLQSHEFIRKVDGVEITKELNMKDTVKMLKAQPGQSHKLEVQTPFGETENVTVTADDDGVLGLKMVMRADTKYERVGLLDAANYAAIRWVSYAQDTAFAMSQLASTKNPTNQVAGPVGIVQSISSDLSASSSKGALFCDYMALISVNIGIVNLLPIPALDGGYLFLIMIEALSGQKLSKENEKAWQGFGTVTLGSLGLFLLLRDSFDVILPK